MENKTKETCKLEEAIVRAVAYFDMFDYPLTVLEIWRYLAVKAELSEVMDALTSIGRLIDSDGFYLLPGREAIVRVRQDRYRGADEKFKRAIKIAKLYKLIPWIKLVAIGNLMGAHNLKPEGDLDFFIVTEKSRLWLTRFFCTSAAALLGLRPGTKGNRNRICLSFFVSEEGMDLSGLMIDSKDIYFIHWLAGLTPLYDQSGVYEKLIEKNSWLNEALPNWQPLLVSRRRDAGRAPGGFYRRIAEIIFGGLEGWSKKIQLKLLPVELKRPMNTDSRVVINDQVLKFHANDRREEYREKYQKKINEILK